MPLDPTEFAADHVAAMPLLVLPSLDAVDPNAWDALGGDDFPFVSHAFLQGLQRTGCVGQGTAWAPRYLLWLDPADGELDGAAPLPQGLLRPRAAAPAYLKTDGRGEYVFDWAWADACARAGLPYYPKLVVAAPFAPANGPKLLVGRCGSRAEADGLRRTLAEGLWALTHQSRGSSAHVLLCSDDDASALAFGAQASSADVGGAWHRRATLQYQWHNPGVGDFEGFLGSLRSRARKQIRSERRVAEGHGLRLQVEGGDQLSADDWQAVADLYERGCLRYGSMPYLRPAFFSWLAAHLAGRVVCATARDDDGEIVAMTLNFLGRDALYGRHWGAVQEWPMLHFELAYYRLIAFVAEHGLGRLEAGSGGDHKLARGLQPTVCHSLHRFADPRLAVAVAGFLDQEREAVAQAQQAIAAQGRQRRGELGSDDGPTRESRSRAQAPDGTPEF